MIQWVGGRCADVPTQSLESTMPTNGDCIRRTPEDDRNFCVGESVPDDECYKFSVGVLQALNQSAHMSIEIRRLVWVPWGRRGGVVEKLHLETVASALTPVVLGDNPSCYPVEPHLRIETGRYIVDPSPGGGEDIGNEIRRVCPAHPPQDVGIDGLEVVPIEGFEGCPWVGGRDRILRSFPFYRHALFMASIVENISHRPLTGNRACCHNYGRLNGQHRWAPE